MPGQAHCSICSPVGVGSFYYNTRGLCADQWPCISCRKFLLALGANALWGSWPCSVHLHVSRALFHPGLGCLVFLEDPDVRPQCTEVLGHPLLVMGMDDTSQQPCKLCCACSVLGVCFQISGGACCYGALPPLFLTLNIPPARKCLLRCHLLNCNES